MSSHARQPISRLIEPRVIEALADTRVVVLLGARQVGKSTLARMIASRDGRQVVSLDDPVALGAAQRDPAGFVANLHRHVVIDEVQRAPALLLAIKRAVDEDPTPGRFLLTGSADVFSSRQVIDALTGRVEVLRLRPLSQAEIHRTGPPKLVDALFAGEPPPVHGAPAGRAAFIDAIAAGGYPEAIGRAPGRRRDAWFSSYLSSSLEHDLAEFADVRRMAEMPRLLRLLAARSAGLLVPRNIATSLDIHPETVATYVGLLEGLFLIQRLGAWRPGLGVREAHAPKVYVTDTGLLAHLLGADATRIGHDDQVTGSAVETFVAMETLAQLDVAETDARAFHYRDHRHEIDLVLEDRSGQVVAIEVKASATLHPSADRLLRRLRDQLGPRFRAGAVLYTGANTLPLGDRLWAVPLSALWTPTR